MSTMKERVSHTKECARVAWRGVTASPAREGPLGGLGDGVLEQRSARLATGSCALKGKE